MNELEPKTPLLTPDGRYIVIVGKAGPRLWRASNPNLPEDERLHLVCQLMAARRRIRVAKDADERLQARLVVDETKQALGERGPVWWNDGEADLSRRLVKHTPYLEWWYQQAS